MKLVLSILLALFIPIFGISDSSENKPISDKTETVKDQFGIDTGMTKIEYDEFKEDYKIRASKLLPVQSTNDLFKFKIDPTKIKELDKFRVNIYKPVFTYREHTLFSDIIVIGSVIGKEKPVGRDLLAYTIEIDEILKGEDILISKLGKIPERLYFFHKGEILDLDNPRIVLNQKGIYFLDRSEGMNKDKQWLDKVPYSTLLHIDGTQMLYERDIDMYEAYNSMNNNESSYPEDHWITIKKNNSLERMKKSLQSYDSWEKTISTIKKIIEINDSENFYKKSWK